MKSVTGDLRIIFGVTYALQQHDATGAGSGWGQRQQGLELIRSEMMVSLADLFIEAHPNLFKTKCDCPSALLLDKLAPFLVQIKPLDSQVNSFSHLHAT